MSYFSATVKDFTFSQTCLETAQVVTIHLTCRGSNWNFTSVCLREDTPHSYISGLVYRSFHCFKLIKCSYLIPADKKCLFLTLKSVLLCDDVATVVIDNVPLLVVFVSHILACVHNRNYNVKECEKPVQIPTWGWLASLYIGTFSVFTQWNFNNVYLLTKRTCLKWYPGFPDIHTLGFIAQAVCVCFTLCFTAKGLVYTALSSHPEWTDSPHR